MENTKEVKAKGIRRKHDASNTETTERREKGKLTQAKYKHGENESKEEHRKKRTFTRGDEKRNQ